MQRSLKEYVLSEIKQSFPVIDGKIIAFSDGLHIYSHFFDVVDCLNVQKIQIDEQVLLDKQDYERIHGV